MKHLQGIAISLAIFTMALVLWLKPGTGELRELKDGMDRTEKHLKEFTEYAKQQNLYSAAVLQRQIVLIRERLDEMKK